MFEGKNGGLKNLEKRKYGKELIFSVCKFALANNKWHVLQINIKNKTINISIPYNKNRIIGANWKKPGFVLGF